MRNVCLCVCVLGIALTAADAVRGADKAVAPKPATAERIDFTADVRPYDPFLDGNQRDQPALKTVKAGEAFTVVIHGNLKPGYHTYPFTQRSSDPAQDVDGLSKLRFEDVPGVKRLGPPQESQPEFKVEQSVGVFLEFEHPFRLTQDFVVLPGTKSGPVVLRFQIDVTVCDNTCVNGTHALEVPLIIEANPEAKLPPELEARLKEKDSGIAVVPVPPDLATKVSTALKPAEGDEKPPKDGKKAKGEKSSTSPEEAKFDQMSLWGQLLWTMGGALAMLFTPCVFPMIPVTVSFFLKQSEKQHTNPLLLASVYSGTIIVILTAAVLALGSVIIAWADNAWLNLFFGLLLTFFALSLFGMYEIELPHFLTRYTSSREGQGGLVGAVFMALTFTITSFTCTGPFLGIVLAPAAATKLGWGSLVLLALVYSVTFAAPFFLLASFPGLLKKLPKSGGWLNSVKVVMGFLELAFAFKFLSITDAAWNPGNPRVFTYDAVLCGWIALSLAAGLYLLGFIRLPHDTPLEHVGVMRLMLSCVLIGLALYMTPALWGRTPAGFIGENLIAILPLKTPEDQGPTPGPESANGRSAEVYWYQDYETAWKRAVDERKLLFIDFTGQNCQNCRSNENNVFKRAVVRGELSRYVCVQLYTDTVPKRGLSAQEAKAQGDQNLLREQNTFGNVARPLYIVFKPDRKVMEEDGKLRGEELARHLGLITDTNAFLEQVLRAPLNTQVARAE